MTSAVFSLKENVISASDDHTVKVGSIIIIMSNQHFLCFAAINDHFVFSDLGSA